MLHYGIFTVLWSMLMCSFGFTINHSVALVPSTWDTAPSLDAYRRVIVDPALNSRMQTTNVEKILRAADTKELTKLMEKTETREKRSTTENIEPEIKLINDAASAMRNNASNSSKENTTIIAPRNVILLLIDERGQEERKEENLWKNYKDRLPFVIEGFLQSCRDNTKANFPLDSKLIFENKEKDCDCEHILRSNIGNLLFWARQTKGMTTGAISGSNFSIPSFPIYEFDKSNKSKRDSNAWQVIDLSDQAKSAPTLITTDSKTEEGMNYDGAWDIFDVFSKIRMAFFRSLLESLGRNDDTSENEFSSRKSFSFQPPVTNLIKNTIRELKSIPNDKGYMLIATVPRSERTIVIDLLQHEISPKDTLLVVTQICAGNKKSVSFSAQGLSNQILREARTVAELPIMIKKAITSDCHDQGCTNRQKRNIPIIAQVPIFSEKFLEQKRVVRNNDAIEKPRTSKLNNTNVKDIISTEETITITKEKQARSSTFLQTTPCGPVIMFGVATSILVMAISTSS